MKSNKYSDYLQHRFQRYAIVITAVMCALFIVFLAVNILINTVFRTQKSGRDIAQLLENSFNGLEQGMGDLCIDSSLISALGCNESALQPTAEKLYAFSNSRPVSTTFLLMNKNGQIICTNLYKSNQQIFENSDTKQLLITRLLEKPQLPYLAISHIGYDAEQNGDYLFAKAVSNNGSILGFLVFDVRDDALYKEIFPYNLDQVIITDRFDNILFSTRRMQIDPMDKYPSTRYRQERSGRWTVVSEGKQYYIFRQPFRNGTLQVYALTAIAFQQQLFVYGIIILLGMGSLLILILSRFIRHQNRRNLVFIEELAFAARQIGNGDLSYRVKTNSFDEFQILGDALNALSENLQCMIRHNAELAEHKRLLELGQLESQFNPHFIFNTMEAIRYKILMEPNEAAEMVLAFSNLMRYSMNFGSSLIALRTDVLFLKDYLLLQKIRFGDRLDYLIDIDEILLDKSFPKLLLQPLVENSLGHGAKQTRKISIHIVGRKIGNKVQLSVEDNGDSIPPELLASLKQQMRDGERTQYRHFGLYSVHRTIRLIYGKQYGITINSSLGNGTKITLHMPWKESEPDEV